MPATVPAVLLAAVLAMPGSAHAEALRYCDAPVDLTAAQHDVLLRVAAIVREELQASGRRVALVSRSGLDLGRFALRYSHAGIALPAEAPGAWSVRQLYYDCDERRGRLFDQGLAGFLAGTRDPALGFVSIVTLPVPAGDALERVVRDNARALALLQGAYSANAHAFSLRYQNCNQWVVETLAAAWAGDEPAAGAPDGAHASPRAQAQRWLRTRGYAPASIDAGPWLRFAGSFVPFVHDDDHPAEDLARNVYRVSVPESIEPFVRAQASGAERIEICHRDRTVVVRRGWPALAAECVAAPGDRSIALD
jgi:hypothetical protein